MPAAGVLLLAGAAALYGFCAPVRRALALLVAVTVLVPATLVVPNGFSAYPTVGRVVLLAVAANLLRRLRAGTVPAAAAGLTPVHAALAGLVAVSLTCGVALAAPSTPGDAALATFVGVAEQLLFFAVVLVAVRAVDDPRWVLTVVGGVLAASVGIALLERLLELSWGRFLFSGLAAQQATDPAKPLELRLGDVRVRAGAQFALQFAWVTAALLPVALVNIVARSRRSWWWTAVVGGAVVAVAWSVSRSAVPGIGLAVLVAWLAAGPQRRLGRLVAGGLAAVVVAALLVPSLTTWLDSGSDEGSIESRTLKVPAVLGFVADDPWTGLGHNGLDPTGIASTDNSLLLAYAETGVVGAAALVLAVLVGIAAAGRGITRSQGDDRLAQAAALAGAVALAAGSFAFDAFSLQGSAGPFWLLVAVAVACSERAVGRWRLGRVPARRGALPAAGLVLGLAVAVLAPAAHARNLRVDTLPVRSVTNAGETQLLRGRTLVATGCEVAEEVAHRAGASTLCRSLPAPGTFLLRLEAGDEATVALADEAVREAVGAALADATVADVAGTTSGRPTGATVAPFVLAVVGAAAAVLLPVRRPPVRSREPELVLT